MLTLTYQYKLVPTAAQVAAIERMLDVCRSVWNDALRERKDWLKSRQCRIDVCSLRGESIVPADAPFPGLSHQQAQLAQARKTDPRLHWANAQVLQQTLRQLDRAFTDMWRRGFVFPRFKKRLRSFVFPQFKECPLQGNRIKLPKLAWVRLRLSRPVPEPQPSGQPLGIDLGLDRFLATSDGELIDRPRFLARHQRKLKLLQRRLRNKRVGSSNWRKLQHRIARLHERVEDARGDWHYKLAHYLCDRAGMVFVEELDFTQWAKGMLGKHTLDASFGQFCEILRWVAWKRGRYFARVDPSGTSRTCPDCGAHTGGKPLSQRQHDCPECGYRTHRDVAAAQVISTRGQRGMETARGGDAPGRLGALGGT